MSRPSARIQHRPRGTARTRAHALLSDIAVGVLSFLILVCVGLATPALWTVIVESTKAKPPTCDSRKSPVERSICEHAEARQRDRRNANR